MVTKSMKFTNEEWKIIEEELKKSGTNFSDFARERLTKKQKTENTNLKDFAELLKNNCKVLDVQIAKYISVLLERIDKQQNKINKILENKTYAEFYTIASRNKNFEKLKDINTFQVGDILESEEHYRNIILKIDHKNKKMIITPFPLMTDEEYFQKEVTLSRVVEKVEKLYRIKKD